jgi:hypothetical protein
MHDLHAGRAGLQANRRQLPGRYRQRAAKDRRATVSKAEDSSGRSIPSWLRHSALPAQRSGQHRTSSFDCLPVIGSSRCRRRAYQPVRSVQSAALVLTHAEAGLPLLGKYFSDARGGLLNDILVQVGSGIPRLSASARRGWFA